MEQKKKANQKRKARNGVSNNHSNNSYNIACDNRTLLTTENWSVIPILNSIQVANSNILSKAQFGFK